MSEYLEQLISDSFSESMYLLIDKVVRNLNFSIKNNDYSVSTIETRIDDYYFIKGYAESNNEKFPELNFDLRNDELLGEIRFKLAESFERYSEIRIRENAEKSQNKYKAHFNLSFHYKLNENDFNKLQTLLNEMRDLISKSNLINEKHKTRLLKRLEVLQAELHKKMNNFDKIWSFVGDTTSTLGNYGQKSKKYIDIIKDIVSIVLNTQQMALGLPPSPNVNLLIEFKSTNEENKKLPNDTENSHEENEKS